MSDDTLQELRREFEATGSRAAEVAYLRERLRAGALSAERVELAAALGCPAAQDLCPQVSGQAEHTGTFAWVQTLVARIPPQAEEAALRAALAVAWAVTREYGRETGRVEQALAEAEQVLLLGSAELQTEIRDRLGDEIERAEDDRCGSVLSLAQLLALAVRIHLADGAEIERTWWGHGEDFVYASFHERLTSELESLSADLKVLIEMGLRDVERHYPAGAARDAAREELFGTIASLSLDPELAERASGDARSAGTSLDLAAGEALRAELVPWLLDYADPVQARVDARP